MDAGTLEAELARRLDGASRIAVLGIGDDLNPRDRPGILAALMVHALAVPGVTCYLTGTMPENFTSALRKDRPSHVIMIDAADMERSPGSVGIIHPAQVRGQRFSTHAMPLTLVIEYIEQDIGAEVVLVGIQPDPVPPTEDEPAAPSASVWTGIRQVSEAFSKATRGMW
jgi:hydrogenase 3 maturation protease